ncbi:MAG: GxxExxY protein [Patescibacteria group bacterium]|nr:GxxExxY protein [Patescibacteria group bacterium]
MQGGEQPDKVIYKELSYEIIRILFNVYNNFGYGYQEKYYQKAIEVEFQRIGIKYKPQCPYQIRYKGKILGRYFIDFIIDDKIVLEIKRGNHFCKKDFDQVIGYLKASRLKLGILAIFSPNGLKFKRVLNLK